MPGPFLLGLHGDLVVKGKKPDGDSMRFRPDTPAALEEIGRADRVELSRDGTVQLRLEGIDTPETHYGTLAQPLGDQARDALLSIAGFDPTQFTYSDSGAVTSATPETSRAVMLTAAAEANGRPIAYLLPGAMAAQLADGEWTRVDDDLVRATHNAKLLEQGHAYLTLYTSTPASHRRTLRAISRTARDAHLGVWASDSSAEYQLRSQDDIGPQGTLILPKLFRRSSDYLKAVAGGFQGTIDDWLVGVSVTGRRPEDDRLLVCGRTEVTLSAVVRQLNSRVRFSADILDIVFVEK